MYPADLLPKPGSAAEGSAAATAESLRGFGACYLRPELVAAYANAAGEALSANSYLELAEPNEVRRGNNHRIVSPQFTDERWCLRGAQESRLVNERLEWAATRASRHLREVTIPTFAAALNSLAALPCSGAALAGAMHGAGINMRYLGLVAERATLPHVHDLLVVEMLCRQVSSTTERIRVLTSRDEL